MGGERIKHVWGHAQRLTVHDQKFDLRAGQIGHVIREFPLGLLHQPQPPQGLFADPGRRFTPGDQDPAALE